MKEGGLFDIQKVSGFLPGLPFAKYKGEQHLPQHHFTGTNSNLQERLNPDDTPKADSIPINRVDEAAYRHDLKYRDFQDKEQRHIADQKMIDELNNIQNPTIRERIERTLVMNILRAKLKIGVGLDTKQQLANEIHKQFRKPNELLKVKVFNKDDIWSADLIEMASDKGAKYILTVIDLFTRYAWVVPLKNKTGLTLKDAFENIMKVSGRHPKKVWVDRGTEF